MPLISTNLTLERVMNLASMRFSGKTLAQIINSEVTHERTKLPCVLLHVKKSTQTVKLYRQKEKTRSTEAPFHRFLLFAEAGTKHVFALFTANESETSQLLRFSPNLYPGSTCLILNARHRDQKYLQDTDNPLLTTVEPLVPILLEDNSTVAPEYSPINPDFEHFCFNTDCLKVISLSPITKLCSGMFCDGQTLGDPCGCKEVDLKKHSWGVQMEVVCPELRGERVDNLSCVFNSKRIKKLFMSNSVNIDPNEDNFDTFAFESAAIDCVKLINKHGGFRIHGWFKPSTNSVSVGSNSSPLHVISIDVIKPDILQNKDFIACQYKIEDRLVVRDIPGSVVAGYVVPRAPEFSCNGDTVTTGTSNSSRIKTTTLTTAASTVG